VLGAELVDGSETRLGSRRAQTIRADGMSDA
jgi:hypothetical protein